MVNNKLKLVKSATAFVIGAAVLTGSFAAAGSDTAFAKSSTSVKVSNGKLVYKSTGKVVKGYKTYNKALYKDGKKLTGLYKKTYYKAGKKATGTYKSVYYKAGKAFTGVTNKTYYKAGKKATGTYKNVYYKSGKAYTGVVNKTYYKAGKKATGLYKGVYYKTGKAATGIYKDQLYISGNLSKGLELYKDQLYKDASLNKGLALYKDQLYKDAVLNKGLIEFEGKFYFDAALANDTYTDQGVERAFENGVEVGAKVKAVEAINATQVKVTFNKAVDKDAAEAVDSSSTHKSTVVKLAGSDLTSPELTEDGRTLILTAAAAINADNATIEVEPVATKADANVKTARYASLLTYKDVVAPTVASTEKVNYTTIKVNFSEPVQSAGTWTYKDKDGNTQNATTSGFNGKSVNLSVDATKVVAGSTVTFTGVNIADIANNLITPNPVTINFTVSAKDEVAPTVASITQTGGKKFEITFDKAVLAGTVTVGGSATTVAPKTKGATTDTTFVVTTTNALNDAQTVAVSGFANVDGTSMAAYSKVVAFQKDAVAPTVTASKLVTVGNAKFIELTFNKEVTEGQVNVAGSYVKDYVTTPVASTPVNATYPTTDTSKKVLLVPVASFATVIDGKYDLTVSSTAVKSDSDVSMASAAVSFTLVDTTVVNEKVFVDGDIAVAKTAAPSVLKVTFSNETPDGATAIAPSNYKVNGQTVKSVKLTSANTAELTLNPGQIAVSGNYNVTVSGVKVKDSTKVMGAVTKTVLSLDENVAPTIKSTILKDNGTAAVAATVVSSNPDATVTGSYTGTVNDVATYTHNGTDWVADKTLAGVTVNVPATGASGDKFTVTATAATVATGATITLTASENLNTTVASDAFEVFAGSTKLDLAASNAIIISGNTITIKLASAVTSAQLVTGLTVKPTANTNVKDSVGNALDIAQTGVQVAQ
ncbi:hypothetical protein [Viridibacillus arvi]|uniref:hypothetical protein n=1 Tax=Viridibacillus arvi TaxID=263475 RepID=UPI003D004CF2